MLKAVLPADGTIAGLMNTLNRPGDYVQGVFAHMWVCKKKFGDASARIGVTGEGRVPHYIIEYTGDRGATEIFGTYHGSSHDLINLGKSSLVDRIGEVVLSDDPAEVAEADQKNAKRQAEIAKRESANKSGSSY
jgi:hypothetical protein